MTTTTMKTLSIKLTNIWMDCQKQMIDMRNEITDLKASLKTSENIRKYLEKVNENLVAIIELCEPDVTGDHTVRQLVGSVKELECNIEREKQNLQTFVDTDRREFNDRTIDRLNRDWNRCKKLKISVLTYDKSIQTINEELFESSVVSAKCQPIDDNYCDNSSQDISNVVNNNDVINGSKEDNISCCPPIGDSVVDDDDDNNNNQTNDWKDIGSDYSAEDREDFDINFNHNDSDDSDFVTKRMKTKTKKKKMKTKTKVKTKKQLKKKSSVNRVSSNRYQCIRMQKINDMVMPLKFVDDNDNDRYYYRCDQTDCQFTNKNKKLMFKHLLRHNNNNNNNNNKIGSDVVVDEELLRQMQATAEPFKTANGMFVCNNNTNNNETTPDCHYRTRNLSYFCRHLKNHENKSKTTATDNQVIHKRLDHFVVDNHYQCLRDGCQFRCPLTDKMAFFDHHKQHNKITEPLASGDSQRPFACDKCTKLFRDISDFRRHRRDVHPQAPYVCNVGDCRVRIKSLKHLIQHWDNIHRRIHRFECHWPGCGYRAFTQEAVNNHQLVHSDVKELSCEWPGCQYRCKVRWCLVSHMRTHTREKPYQCDWPGCQYSAAQQCALTVHKRRHTGEKPYECPQDGCGKRFSALSGLYIHRKQHRR
ncbi:zinc finger protein 239-like [Oppia nitens]|uniref:zinc finger protein 239-like n=1 Tax=Oppia nitens TaxID=1686743 RepID=UPI0023DC3AE7|nr:zinc finger protein 239-like [Oppia nitens]